MKIVTKSVESTSNSLRQTTHQIPQNPTDGHGVSEAFRWRTVREERTKRELAEAFRVVAATGLPALRSLRDECGNRRRLGIAPRPVDTASGLVADSASGGATPGPGYINLRDDGSRKLLCLGSARWTHSSGSAVRNSCLETDPCRGRHCLMTREGLEAVLRAVSQKRARLQGDHVISTALAHHGAQLPCLGAKTDVLRVTPADDGSRQHLLVGTVPLGNNFAIVPRLSG